MAPDKTPKGTVGLGRRGEALAARALCRCGYTLITQNWYCPYGEVDLVMQHDDDLYFVEVRTRRCIAGPSPEQSVTRHKRSRMELVARAYLGTHAPAPATIWHLAVVAVTLDRSGRLRRITFYPDLEAVPEDLVYNA